jgi:hypothetical protein
MGILAPLVFWRSHPLVRSPSQTQTLVPTNWPTPIGLQS